MFTFGPSAALPASGRLRARQKRGAVPRGLRHRLPSTHARSSAQRCSRFPLFSFSVGWHCKAFADFQGNLSACPLSKSVAAPRWKQSAKRRTKGSVAGDLGAGTPATVSAEELLRAAGPALSPGSWLRYKPQSLLCVRALPQCQALSGTFGTGEKTHNKTPDASEEQGRKVAPQAPWRCGEPDGGTCHTPSPDAT